MLDKIKLVISLMASKTYLVLTDTKAVVMIPLMNMNKINNVIILSSQLAALEEFQTRLKELIEEHEEAVRKLN